jgi:hypothetical protein
MVGKEDCKGLCTNKSSLYDSEDVFTSSTMFTKGLRGEREGRSCLVHILSAQSPAEPTMTLVVGPVALCSQCCVSNELTRTMAALCNQVRPAFTTVMQVPYALTPLPTPLCAHVS